MELKADEFLAFFLTWYTSVCRVTCPDVYRVPQTYAELSDNTKNLRCRILEYPSQKWKPWNDLVSGCAFTSSENGLVLAPQLPCLGHLREASNAERGHLKAFYYAAG